MLTPEQRQAMELCAEAIARGDAVGAPWDGVALTIMTPAGVATFTMRQCADEMRRLHALGDARG